MTDSVQNGICTKCGRKNITAQLYEFALPLGTVVGRKYLVGLVAGVGGCGITYAAIDLETEKKVAIKECFARTICQRADDGKRVRLRSKENREEFDTIYAGFEKEAQILKVNSGVRGIIALYDIFYENDTLYYAMEFLEGISLEEYLKKKGGLISFKETLTLLEPIFDAVIGLHKCNIIHRDISPDNIIVCADGTPRLIDYGLAREAMYGKSRIVDFAKEGYAPIELYQDDVKQGPWSDVYSLAATVYRCCTGKKMISAEKRSEDKEGALLYSAVFPEEMAQVMIQALACMPSKRYSTVAEFKRNLYERQKTDVKGICAEQLAGQKDEAIYHGPMLLAAGGCFQGLKYRITGSIILGRQKDLCQIVFPEDTPGVSAKHCQITLLPDGKEALLRDLGSTYGTKDNSGCLIEPGKDKLVHEGEKFTIGENNTFIFKAE
jgi:predicted Ser/Thr protein kinase